VLTLEQLFQVWYRGNINAGGPQGANPWEAASDPALAFPTPTLYSICQKIGSQLVVLGLDSERGFLPTASKMYRKNGDGWLKHSEFVVALDDALSTALVPVPRTIDQYRFRLGKLDGEPFQMVLDSVIWEAPDDQSFYEVPFPKTVSPNDLSPQKSILIGGPSVRQPGGYSVWQWFALLFTVVLSVSAFVRYKRTHSS
jgi:hypothetical protein